MRTLHLPLSQKIWCKSTTASQRLAPQGTAVCGHSRCKDFEKAVNPSDAGKVDIFGDHFQNCQKMAPFRTMAHTEFRNYVGSLISMHTNARVKTEVSLKSLMDADAVVQLNPGNKRTDISISPALKAGATHIDLCFTAATKANNMPAAKPAGREMFKCLDDAMVRKWKTYGGYFKSMGRSQRFLPLIISTHGRWHEKSLAAMKCLLHDCAPEERRGRDDDTLSANALLNNLQRAAGAFAINAMWERTFMYRDAINETAHGKA